MPLSDQRFLQLTEWLQSCLLAPIQLSLISGDASFRRYFRFNHNGKSYIAVDSPPNLVPISPFIELSTSYQTAGLNVPSVLHFDTSHGFMMLSDLGDNMLNSALKENTVIPLYKKSLDLLPAVARVKATESHHFPKFDDDFIQTELNIFTDWLLGEHLNYAISPDTKAMLDNTFNRLSEVIRSQPQVAMHRDYHSRNIMLHEQKLYLIDYQDTVLGPLTYDAVSLLRDCYAVWSTTTVSTLMKYHHQLCIDKKLLASDCSFDQYQYWFDLTGMQRHLKIAGIFARLHHRDGKSGYLADIPKALHYLIEVTNRYTEFSKLSDWLQQDILPSVEAKL